MFVSPRNKTESQLHLLVTPLAILHKPRHRGSTPRCKCTRSLPCCVSSWYVLLKDSARRNVTGESTPQPKRWVKMLVHKTQKVWRVWSEAEVAAKSHPSDGAQVSKKDHPLIAPRWVLTIGKQTKPTSFQIVGLFNIILWKNTFQERAPNQNLSMWSKLTTQYV